MDRYYPTNNDAPDGSPGNYSRLLLGNRWALARARASKDGRAAKQLESAYRALLRDKVKLNTYIDPDGFIGVGRYRRRRGRTMRRRRVGRRGMRGRGFYKGFGGDAGEFIGNAASRGFGVPGLGALGRSAGNWISGKLGFGAYGDGHSGAGTISQPVPIMMNVSNREGCVIFTKREYLFDVVSPNNGFNPVVYDQGAININPGNRALCPWFHNIARNFESWRLKSMIFEYVSHSGDTTTSTQIGRVMGAHSTDMWRSGPKNVRELQQMALSNVGSAAQRITWGFEADPRLIDNKWRLVRNKDIGMYDEDRWNEYDIGKMYFFTEGVPGTNTSIGAMYVSYEFEMARPIDRPDCNAMALIEGVSNDTSILHTTIVQAKKSNNFPYDIDYATVKETNPVQVGTTVVIPKGESVVLQLECQLFGAGVPDPYIDLIVNTSGGTGSARYLSAYSGAAENVNYSHQFAGLLGHEQAGGPATQAINAACASYMVWARGGDLGIKIGFTNWRGVGPSGAGFIGGRRIFKCIVLPEEMATMWPTGPVDDTAA